MHSVLIAVIVFGGLVLALAVIGSTILMGLKAVSYTHLRAHET